MIKHTKKQWTDEEIVKLVGLWSTGAPIKIIAEKLKRKRSTVRAKVSNLRKEDPRLSKKLTHRTINENYKLEPKDIPFIRKDKRSLKKIGDDYGVSAVTIFKVQTGKTWKNV